MLLCAAPFGTVVAQENTYSFTEPSDVAIGEKTYFELVGMVFPGAVLSDTAVLVDKDVELPHIEGPDFAVAVTAPVTVESIRTLQLNIEERPHLALMLDVSGDEPIAALALFDISADPVLVDVKDVAADRFSSFAEPAILTVGQGHDLILVSNSHGNAGQYYDAITIVDVVGGELQMVDVVLTLDDQACGGSETQTAEFSSVPMSAGRGDFEVSVTDVIVASEEDCGSAEPYQPGETIYRVTYRWDAAAGRYVAQGDGWAELDDLNGERF